MRLSSDRGRRRGSGNRRGGFRDKGDINSEWKHDLFVDASGEADQLDRTDGAAAPVVEGSKENDVEMIAADEPLRRADTKFTIVNTTSRVSAGTIAYKIRFSDLHYEVDENDLKQLIVKTCSSAVAAADLDKSMQTAMETVNSGGNAESNALKSIKIIYDAAGRSEGLADVVVETEEIARKLIEDYDGFELGGQRISVKLVGPIHVSTSTATSGLRAHGGASGWRGRGSRRGGRDGVDRGRRHQYKQYQQRDDRRALDGGIMARLGGPNGGAASSSSSRTGAGGTVMSRLDFGESNGRRYRNSGPYDRPRRGARQQQELHYY